MRTNLDQQGRLPLTRQFRRRRCGYRDCVWLLALGLVAGHSWGQSPPPMWLDEPLQNWNAAPTRVPKAPKGFADFSDPMCKGVPAPHVAATPAERAVSAAGWLLDGPEQRHGQTLLIAAKTDIDGMCRPMNYQYFIFVAGEFAGTVSPVPMNSRVDGAGFGIRFSNELAIVADFQRYAPSDPMCCPSRTSRVSFAIEWQNGRPVLAPQAIQTIPR